MDMVLGKVDVSVTKHGKGLSADDLAHMCTDKIVYVGPNVPPVIKEQAVAFRDHILYATRHYMDQAQKSERTSIIGALEQAGFIDAANLVRKI